MRQAFFKSVETLYSNLKENCESQTILSMNDVDKIDALDCLNTGKQEKQYEQFILTIKEIKGEANSKLDCEFNKDELLRFIGQILSDISVKKELWRYIDIKHYMFEQIFYSNYKQSKVGDRWKAMLYSLRKYSTVDDRLDTICMFLNLSERKIEINAHVCRMYMMILSETKHSIGKIFDSEPAILFTLADASKLIFRYIYY